MAPRLVVQQRQLPASDGHDSTDDGISIHVFSGTLFEREGGTCRVCVRGPVVQYTALEVSIAVVRTSATSLMVQGKFAQAWMLHDRQPLH